MFNGDFTGIVSWLMFEIRGASSSFVLSNSFRFAPITNRILMMIIVGIGNNPWPRLRKYVKAIKRVQLWWTIPTWVQILVLVHTSILKWSMNAEVCFNYWWKPTDQWQLDNSEMKKVFCEFWKNKTIFYDRAVLSARSVQNVLIYFTDSFWLSQLCISLQQPR